MLVRYDPMLSAHTIFFATLVLLLLSSFVTGSASHFSRLYQRKWPFITGLAFLTTAVSFFVVYSRYSGEGIATLYGWPHAMYVNWLSLDHSVREMDVPIKYVGINLFFYASLYTFLFSLERFISSKE